MRSFRQSPALFGADDYVKRVRASIARFREKAARVAAALIVRWTKLGRGRGRNGGLVNAA